MDEIQKVTIMHYEMIEDKKTGYKVLDRYDISELICEQGINKITIFNAYKIFLDGIAYYLIADEVMKGRFGENITLKDLLLDKRISDEEKQLATKISRSQDEIFFLNTQNKLEMYKGNVAIKPSKIITFDTTNIVDNSVVIKPSYEWYLEYTKYTEDGTYLKPTFYSDKTYRFDSSIDKYRFVKVAKFKKGEKDIIVVVKKEDEWQISDKPVNKDEVDNAIDFSISYIAGAEQQKMFEGYTRLYPFNTERSCGVFAKNKEYIDNKDVLSITGSGDALLDLFKNGAKSVTCFDINGLAKFLAKMKFLFIKAGITYEEYIKFFSAAPQDFNNILNFEIYDKYSYNLDRESKKYWDAIIRYLKINKCTLEKNKNTLFYSTYDVFIGLFYNGTFAANGSYLENKESFTKLQDILKNKSLDDCNFVDASLFDVDNIFKGRQFQYIYLSNVLDFADDFFDFRDSIKNKEAFKQFIVNNLSSILSEDGWMDVSYIKDTWSLGGIEDTKQVFSLEEGFVFQSLEPYNKDCILSISATALTKSIENIHHSL